MSNLTTIPKGDSAWLLRKAIQQVIEQVNTLEANVNPAATGGSLNTQVLFNDNGAVKGDTNFTYNKTTDTLTTINGQFTDLNASGNVAVNNLTVSGTFTTLSGQNASAIRAAASDYAAVSFDGTTASTRIVSPCQALGTGDFSLWSRFRVPTTTPSNQPVIIALSDSSSSAGTDSAYLSFENADLRFTKFGASSSDARRATISGFVTTYSGQIVDIVVTRTGATLKIFINGTDTAYTETTAGTPPAWSSSVNSSFVIVGARSSTTIFTGRIYRSVVFNRALSASDVTELITVGVNPADQWGTQTAVYTSDYSVDANGWLPNSNMTVTGNIDSGADGAGVPPTNDWLRTTLTASRTLFNYRNNTLIIGKRYLITGSVFVPSGSPVTHAFFVSTAASDPQNGGIPATASPVTAGVATAISSELIARNVLFGMLGNNSSNPASWGAIASGTSLYQKDVIVTRIGAIVDLDLSVGIGLFFPDRSDNRLGGDGFGGISHSMPKEYGSITVVKDLLHSDISLTAATTSLFSLPPNCGVMFVELDRVTAFDVGTTVQIGVSGTAAKFLAATSVATTGITGANSASLISESNSANTLVYIQKSGATSVGRVRVRVTYQIRG